jgi:6-phosphogluconolactonase
MATKVFIGTNTQNTGSCGIYALNMDNDGRLSLDAVIPHEENPSYVAASADGRMLYACSEMDSFSAVTSYHISKGGRLSKAGRSQFGGAGLCQLSVTDAALLGACYNSGSLIYVKLGQDRLPGTAVQIDYLPPAGSGMHSNAHSFVPDPQGRYAVAPNLGMDKLFLYRLTGDGPKPCPDADISLPKGEGPRHFVFHPTLPMAYLSTEYGNHAYAFRYDSATGTLKETQRLDALPQGWTGKSCCAEIRLSADGKTLLVSNRGHDSIACYTVDGQGSLTSAGHIPTCGSWPRGIALAEDDRFLIIANQFSNQVVSVPFHATGGDVQPISVIEVPAPTWVCPITIN